MFTFKFLVNIYDTYILTLFAWLFFSTSTKKWLLNQGNSKDFEHT